MLLGIGLNVNLAAADIPPDLRDKATSVRIATGHPCDRIAIADSLFNRLDTRYMETTRGFAAVRPAWERYSALTGRRIAIVDGGGVIGRRERNRRDGALLLDIGDGVERISPVR